MTVDTLSGTAGRVWIIGTPDQTVRQVEQVLYDQGHAVWHVPGVRHIHDQLRLAPDLILLDARTLPDEVGATLAALQAGAETADAMTILLLPAAPADDLLDLVAATACDFVSEPLREDELVARVELQLRRRKLRQPAQLEHSRRVQAHAAQQRALEEQEALVARYRGIFDRLPIGAFIVSTTNQIEQANEAMCRFIGYDADELIGRQPVFMVLPEDHAATVGPGYQLAAGQIDHFVHERRRYVRKDGSVALGKLTACALRDDAGRPQAFLGFVEDIGSRVWVEDQLARYTRYQQALANSSLSLLTVAPDLESRSQALFQALQQLVDGAHTSRAYLFRNVEDPQNGLALDLIAEAWAAGLQSLRRSPNAQRIPRLPYAMLPAAHRERMLSGRPAGGLAEEIYKETPELLAVIRAESIYSTQTVPVHVEGQLWGMLGFDDCTQARTWDHAELMLLSAAASMIGQTLHRWQIEDDLRATSQFLHTTGRVARVGGWAIDLETRTPTISEELSSILELAPGTQLDVATLLSFYTPEAQPVIQAAAAAAIREGGSWELELPIVTAGGRQLWVSTQGQTEQHDGRTVRLFGVMQDVTQRKEAELRLERQLRIETALAKCSRELLAPVRSEDDLRQIAAVALEHLRAALPIDAAYLMRLVPDPDDPYLTMIAFATVSDSESIADHPFARRFQLTLLSPQRRAALASGQVTLGPPDISEATTPAQREWFETDKIRARITFPVHIDGEWWGVLGFNGLDPRVWDEQEQSVLRTAAEMFSHVLRRWILEGELRRSEEQFRTAVETMLDGFAILDSVRDDAGTIRDFRYRYINEVGCQLNQRSREEQIGRTLLELLPAYQNNALFADYVRLVETGVPVTRESVFYEELYGSSARLAQVFDVRAARLGDGFAVVWRDVTDQRLAHESLAQANDDLLRRVNELRTLNLIAQTLAFTQDLKTSLETVCSAVTASTGAATVAIACYTQHLPEPGHGAGVEPEVDQTAGTIMLAPDELGVLAGPLLTQRRAIILARDKTGFPLSDDVLRRLNSMDAANLLLVPLAAPASNIGLLVLGSGPEGQAFSADARSLVETMASQIATAITNARLAAQAQQAAMLAERNRVARELHDSATQSLYSLVLLSGGWAQASDEGRLESVGDKLRQIGGIALQVLKELRLLIYELRHPDLAQAGLVEALEQRLAAVEQRTSVKVTLTISGELPALPAVHEEQIFSIMIEALNNTLRHAQAHSVAISIRVEDGQALFAVRDDGVGFDPATPSSGVGLSSMRERAAQIGARLTVTAGHNQGTLVEVILPIPDKGDAHDE